MRNSPTQPALVDLAAAAVPLSDADARAHLATQRAFISSVMIDLRSERKAVARAVEELGATPVWFERFGGRDADPEDAYLGEVRSSTIYVGILGKRYGKLLPSRFSATHLEYLEAEKNGLRMSVWTLASEDWDGRQQAFVEEVRTFHTTSSFTGPEDLAAGVRNRLRAIAAEEVSPWCKLGPLVFRAERIHRTSNGIEVTALVRDGRVADALESMAAGGWGQDDYAFTDPFRSLSVRVEDVESTASTASARRLVLRLTDRGGTRHAFHDMSIQTSGRTYLPDDLTEISLREHLFGETAPRDVTSFASLPNPFENFPKALPDEVVRPIARLFLMEALVGTGHTSRINNFRLGTRVAGKRRLVLEWEGAARYANPPVTKSIEGEVSL